MQIVLLRFVSELACLTGVVCAAALAWADKSPWIWSWFLLFGFANIITGGTSKQTTVETASPQTKASDHQS